MARIWPGEVSEAFRAKIEPLIPAPERNPFNLYRHQPGGGKSPCRPGRAIKPLSPSEKQALCTDSFSVFPE